MERNAKESTAKAAITEPQLQQLQHLANTLRHGSLTLIFQDGVLVRIDRNEKIRLA